MSVTIGDYNKLKVLREVEIGVYLDGGEIEGDILMPSKYVPEGTKPDDIIDAFVYTDSEDRIIATKEIPFARVNEFAYLEVKALTKFGAFLDWGILKDLMVPFREQKTEMEAGSFHVVYIYLDDETDRLVASAKIDNFLSDKNHDFRANEEVNILVYKETDIGYKAIVDGKFGGLLYKNEVFQEIAKGDKRKAFIKKIREDGKIDLILQKPGYSKIDGVAKGILQRINDNNGFIAANDKSSPEVIKTQFGISKKSFKKAIGSLYKQRIITFENDGVSLKND